MNLHESRAVQAGVLLAALAVSLPAEAGGGRGKSHAKSGQRVTHNGVAIFNRNTRNLPNGVDIFSRRPRAAHVHRKPSNGRVHSSRSHMNGSHRSTPAMTAQNDARVPARREYLGHTQHKKSKHGRDDDKQVFYGSTVYVLAPAEEYYYPQETAQDNCRFLTERGYDLSGRRVLVEWTVCFDEQGEAFVPEDGRRIVARF